MNTFETLNNINVNGHTEQKNGLTYLSWAWAWAEVSKAYPDADYVVFRNENGLPYFYDENTGYMVMTEVTIDGKTKMMWLPVMDNNNHAMKSEAYIVKTRYKEIEVQPATTFDINKTIMRCLVKNLAMFGLGLYIYAGEDLPECDRVEPSKAKKIDLLRQMLEFYEKGMEKRILKKYEAESLEQMSENDIAEVIDKLDGRKAKVKASKEAEELQAQFDGGKK